MGLISILNESYRKLQPGYSLVISFINDKGEREVRYLGSGESEVRKEIDKILELD